MKQNIWSCRSVVGLVVVLVMGIGFPSLGCFSPSFEEGRISCGPNGECPPGLSCAADRVCRSTSMPIDAAVDAKLIDGKPPIDGDTTAPNVPTLTLVTSSPANNNTPQLTGTTEVGTTVAIYTDSGCITPEPGFEAVSMASLGTGVLVPVAGDTTTQFRARAKDAAGNPSACTSPVTYIEDSTAPVPPMVVDSLPASPSRSLTPTVRGTAEAGATVTLFSDAGCTTMAGTPMVTDVGGAFAIPVSVTVGSSSTFYATARDVALNLSGCSLSNVGYNQDSSAVAVPTFTGTNPTSPSKTSTTPMILGTTEASITVKLYTDNACNGTVVASGSSDASGLFSIPVTVAANTSVTYYGQAQDPVAGTLSLCSGTGITYTHDTVAPMPPLLTGSTPTSPSNATAPSVTGSAEAGAHVDVFATADCSGTAAGSGTVAGDGTFSIPVTIAGTTTFHGMTTDLAGNISSCSGAGLTYTYDAVPPNTPTISATLPSSPSTTNNVPVVVGSAETGATVRLYRSATCTGIEAATGVASGGGFGIGITVTSNSTTPITATATDPAGNVSGCSAALTYVHDSLAPDAPVFTGATPGSPSNVNTPMISGTTEPAATVQLYSNPTCTTALGTSVTANAGGMFTVAITVADDSSTAIYAIATDAANNKSPCSAPFTFVEDSTAPGTPTLSQLPPSISSTTPTLTGTTEGNASVDLFTNGTCSGAAAATSTAAAGGAFAIMVTVTANTTTTFTAKATDAAGNASACSAIATYTHDNMTPTAPSGLATTPVGPASSNSPSVSGMAEAGATVRLFTNPTCSTAVAGTTTAVGGGTFAVAISVANGSTTTFYATATDPAGNGSACSASFITYTQDSAPPSAPTGLATVPVGPSSSNTPSVTGAAEANSTVQIFTNATCTGAPAFSGTASGAGTFAITATVAANTTTTFHANAVDAANNTSACSTSSVIYVEDSTAPSTPTILATSPGSPANNNGPAVSGTAEAGSTVKLYTMVGCAGAIANSGITDGAGAFSIVAAVSDNSTTSFYATATDPAGNVSGCSAARVYVEDSLAPSTPSALDTNPTSPVNNTNPSITGTADAGSTVAIYTSATCSGASIGTGTATVGNTFSIAVSVAANTTSTFYARATDAANNQSSCSSSVSYIEDSTTPGLPTLTSTSPLSPSGSATPTVSGTAEANSTVKIYAGSCTTLLATGTATAGGTFAIVTPVTANATTTLRATATDAASNVSACSTSSLTYTNDATAPTSPTALAVTPAVTANNNAPVVSGLAEAGALVTLYTNAACTTLAGSSGTAAGDGTFAISDAVANNSTTMYYATAQDAAGNVSPCSTSTVTFVEDSLVPAAPTGLTTTPPSPSNVNTPSITGTAEAGSTVKIYSNPACTTQVATGTAAAFASTGITVTVGNDSSTSFYATATDAASNVSACSAAVAYAEDSTAPNAPVITSTNPTSPANDTTPIVGGTTEANSTVKLYTNAACSGAPVGSTASTAGGTFSITANAVTANTTTTYYATATDAAANVSACTAAAFTYVEDSTPPVPPSGLATSPTSPANNNSPLITGSAEANSTVTIFTNATCTGAPAFSTTASAGGTFSKAVAVADNTTTTFYVQATDAAANKSTCNAAGSFITYMEDSSATAVPILVSTTPTSPSNASTTPTVTGTTGAGFLIRIYSNAACTTLLAGPFAADGAGNFTSPAIAVTANTTTTFYATATNTTTSACSSGLVYVHDSMAPGLPTGLTVAPTSPANNNLPTIGGTAEAGATVKLYTNAACTVPAATAGTGTATAGNTFSIPVTGGVIGDNTATTFYATATDAAGNASGCSMQNVAYTEDSAAPALPTLTSTTPASPSSSSTTPTINGTSEANATVKVYTNPTCIGAPAGTASASAAGAFAVPATVSANSTTTFKATATDAAGNVSACSASSIVYTNDNQSPTPPTGLAVTPTGPANNNTPSVSGTAEASSTVNIYTNATCTSTIAGTGTTSALGAFAIAAAAPGDATTTFYAKSIDAAGNASTCSTSTVSYVEDSTAPGLPAFTGTTPTSPSKTSTTPTINGTAEAGATVNLYTTAACGAIVATGTATGGAFAIGVTVTANTTTSYFAKAVDAAGNASACTTLSQTYAHDSVAPAAPVGVSLSPSGPVNNNAPSYVGTSEASATIKVYTNAACTTLSATGSASGAGAFAVPLSVGDNTTTTFYSTATDLAGNVSGCTAAGVTFVEDSTAPATPVVTGTTPVSPSKASTTPAVNGTAEANATIDIYGNAACSGGKLGTGTATGAGTFAVSVTVTANATTTLYALATDSASNVSACSTTSATYTHDNVAPATPGSLATTPASPSSSSTPTLSGTAETGSTVNVYTTNNCSGAIKGTTTAVAGAFSVSGTVALNATTSITAQSVDAAGNLSACSAVLSYTHDNMAPATPAITGSTPTGPSNVNTPVLSGTAETGSTVALYTTAGCAGAPTTGTAIAPGTFAISVTVADNSSTNFYARTTDAAGNASGCSAAAFTYLEDSTPPPAPVLVSVSPTSPSTSTTPTISGTATASTQIKFFVNASCTVAAGFSGVSDATGNFAIGVTVGADTTTTFYAVAIDSAQNNSACSNGLTFVQDSTRPVAPSGLGTSPGSPANNNNPTLTGSAESGATVKVYAGAGCTTLLVSGASTGTFAIALPALADNVSKTYTVDATDAAGNVSSCAGPLTYVEDSLANAPSLVSTNPPTPSSVSTTPTVNGTAEANATIAIFSNATCTNPSIGSATVTGAGTFGVSVSVPANTTTLLYGKITDQAGNVSACSAALAYRHDNVAPMFAGPTSAVATSATSITVSWLSATDNLSPPAALIYEVCASTTPGGCASWTTAATSSAGATSVAVTSLSSSVRYFLRVRVKDQTNNLATSAVEVTDRTWGPGAAVAISTALDFSCELLSEGTVRCWGNNSNGQLGNNSTTTSLIPVAVMGLTDVTQVSAGGSDASTTRFACALKSNGTVWCWGNNTYGQLGNGTNTQSLVPVQVVGVSPATALTNVRAIGAAGAHMCAILVTGSIYCWGYNGVGTLGDATTTNVNRPTTAVVGITNALSVSGGTYHTCALLADGTVKCWGQATNGKLGQGSTAGNFSSPVAVTLAAGTYARALDVGQYHACIITDLGGAQCWGQGTLGQLGDNLSVDASTPVIVKQTSTGVTLSNAVTVSAGNGTTCFTNASGGIRCAGEGTSGQLGNSGVVGSAFATLVTNSPTILTSSRVAVGGDHVCALGANGVVNCWGAGGAGQLGNNGTPATQSTYVAVVGNDAKEAAVQIVAGRRGTCARMSNGKVLCWGFGFYGELGAGSTSEVDYPLAYVSDGTSAITDFIDISRGESFACGVRQTGSVVCWGANNFSQLGNGTSAALPAAQPAATSVLAIGNAYQVSAGLGHACAMRASGFVTCWGDNTYAQIGDGTVVTPVTTPYNSIVATTLAARRVRAQGYGTCAVMADGTAKCWGYNNYGGTGDGTSGGANSPRMSAVVVTSMTNAVEFGGNYIGTCASLANGTIKCWGYGSDGEIGNGTVGSTNATPTQINGGAVYLPILSGGDYHTCATKVDGTVYCWGKNLTGQLGDNTQTSRSTPTLAIGVDTVKGVGVAGGQSDAGHSCVLHSDGYADCWGDGSSGKLGNNDLSMQLTAQPVIYFP